MKKLQSLVVMLLAAAATPAVANEALALIQTRGEAHLTVPADLAELTVSIENSDLNVEAAVANNSTRTRAVREALRKAGVPDEAISTRGFSVTPEWAPRPQGASQDWRPHIRGYRAQHQLRLQTRDLAAMPRWIEEATGAGADQVGQLRYGLADPQAHYQRALAQATRAARTLGETVAAAAGIALGAVHQLEVEGGGLTPLVGSRLEAMAMRTDARPPLEPAEVEVRAAIVARFKIQQ